MAEESRNSIILTRTGAEAAQRFGTQLANRIAPESLRDLLAEDTPPTEPLPAREFLYLKGGYVLSWEPGSAPVLRSRLRAAMGAEIDDAVTVDADRELRRIAPMLNDPIPAPRELTWNLKAIGITGKDGQPTGRGAKVAVLDSGFDRKHPDFNKPTRRRGSSKAPLVEVPRVTVLGGAVNGSAQDERGHGTHTSGIVVGPLRPKNVARYSVAPRAELLVANVADDELTDWNLLKGIVNAAEAGAHVISISVGVAPTQRCPVYSMLFERVAQILLDEYQTIIVAAAGNESNRNEPYIGPIVHPADCPSIIAVGALDEQLLPALTTSGGICDQRMPTLMAPGVAIFSSFLSTNGGPKHFTLNGTSQAAPHVAGAAALWYEATGLTGRALVRRLMESVKPLPDANTERPTRDFGCGLVRVPQ